MKNILNKAYKIVIFSSILFLLQNASANTALAEEKFFVDCKSIYQIEETGNTNVINKITIENKSSEVFAKKYIFKLDNIEPVNVSVTRGDKPLDFTVENNDKTTSITVFFDELITGTGNKKSFNINFDNPDLAVRTGEVWEISVPKLANADFFRNYDTILKVPYSLGSQAYISPKPSKVEDLDDNKIYHFEKEQIENSGISAGFGKFQVFSFNINYHLENSNNRSEYSEIAIPPDTSSQRVHYQNIEPVPENITVDEDGNWIASYYLKPKERLDIKVIGSVQIFASPRKLNIQSPFSLLSNIRPTEYWQSDNDAIRTLAGTLKKPKKIYDYVVNTLNYNFEGVKPDAERLGAIGALKNPDEALCMEFTDLFIAIARASGIPAREVNGYAYTENPEIQPLSLVSDVLHSWPEYWDDEKNTWIPIDPTWGNTSGIDFFEKFDLRHFAFVIHGNDSSKPYPPGSHKLGNNPQKDIFVNFGQLPQDSYSNVEIHSKPIGKLSLVNKKYEIEIINSGSTAEYDITEEIMINEVLNDSTYIKVLPPYSRFKDKININYGLFSSNAPSSLLVKVNNSKLLIPITKTSIIINQLIAISLLLILILILLHPRKPSIKSLFELIKSKLNFPR